MKQGKGIVFYGCRCEECGERIMSRDQRSLAYWAYESIRYGERTYYHRSCARKVTKRREAERARMLAEVRAMQTAGKGASA